MAIYPDKDISRFVDLSDVPHAACTPAIAPLPIATSRETIEQGAAIVDFVTPMSPADDAGFTPGCKILTVNGNPIRDIIDWRWYAGTEDVIELAYQDNDGDFGTLTLERDYDEDWGFSFVGSVFDRVKRCVNNCEFCFMHQLPKGMRQSLYLPDDDFRLSFLSGTFVTLTNLSDADVDRIIEQHLSPLRVSFHACDTNLRSTFIGRNAERGKLVFDTLLAAGIEFHMQIVLVPGKNDGDVLQETLTWAYERPGILGICVVPLGYTSHQSRYSSSFDSVESSKAVLDALKPWEEKALAQRNTPWVFPADEFFCNAYPDSLLENLPSADWYGDFDMYDDGVGMVRTFVDAFRQSADPVSVRELVDACCATNTHITLITGEATHSFFARLLNETDSCDVASVQPTMTDTDPDVSSASCKRLSDVVSILEVKNDFFGGNVTVTGLLCGCDIVSAIKAHANCDGGAAITTKKEIYFVPEVVFNDDSVTLDDMTLETMGSESGQCVRLVSCNTFDLIQELKAEVLCHFQS